MKHTKTSSALGLCSLIAVLFTTGCQNIIGNSTGDQDAHQAYEYRRGTVALVDQELKFTPCFEQKSETISDQTGRLLARLKKNSAPLVYAELSGGRSLYQSGWEARRVHLIGGGNNTCSYELEGNEYRAAGDNPLWIADVRDDAIHVHNFQKLTKLKFKKEGVSQTSSGMEWQSGISGDVEHRVRLRLKNTLCVDSHNTEYEYKAEMVLDGKVFKGCARRGNLDLMSLPGIYKCETAAIEDAQRSITMALTSNGDVRIVQDYQNDQPVVIHKGTWQRLPKKKLVIYLNDVTGNQQGEVLLLQRNKIGALEMKSSSPIFGDRGLQFFRTGFVSAITESRSNN